MGNKTALVLALICAMIASIIVYRTMKEGAKPRTIELPKTAVVFAKTTIPARTVVMAEQLEIKKIPKEAVIQDAVFTIKDVVGLITKSDIIQGEPVNMNRLLRKGDNVGMAFIIPQGMRAVTIPVNEVSGVAGFIRPGEKVDVIEVLPLKNPNESVSWTILQDILILAVSQDMGNPQDSKSSTNHSGSSPKVGTSVTLAVTPVQAQKIALSQEKGTLHLSLRPVIREVDQNIPLIRESNLLPSVKTNSTPPKPSSPHSTKRVIEIISGGKSQFVTVE